MSTLNLVTIVCNWIKKDPLLKKHIHYDPEDLGDETYGAFLCPCSKKKQVRFAIAFISNNVDCDTTTWSWSKRKSLDGKKFPGSRLPDIIHAPGDPQFFKKLKRSLVIAHNSLGHYSGCVLKVPRA